MHEVWIILNKEVRTRRERIGIVMASTFIFMLIANGYSWVEFYPIHDGVMHFLDDDNSRFTSLGRFLTPVYNSIRGNGSLPLLTGLLSVLFSGISTCVVTAFLRQYTRLELVLTSALLSANLFMLEINTSQSYFRDVFLCALMFGCLGAYHVLRGRKGFWLSVLMFFVSFGIYPAFITFVVCLFVSYLCLEMIGGEKGVKQLGREAARFLLSLFVAGVLYLIVARVVVAIYGVQPSVETNTSMFMLGSQQVEFYIGRLVEHYVRFFASFGYFFKYERWAISLSTVLLAALALGLVSLSCIKTKRLFPLVLFAGWLLVFPIAAKLVNILSTNNSFRVSYAQFLLGPLLVSAIFTACRRLRRDGVGSITAYNRLGVATAIACAFIFYGNARFTNRAFMVQRILHDRMMFHTGQVVRDLEEMKRDGTVKVDDKKVAVVGRFNLESSPFALRKMKVLSGFGGDTGVSYPMVFGSVVRRWGYYYDWEWDHEVLRKTLGMAEIKQMPCYPYPGYIREVDGYLVIRLGP